MQAERALLELITVEVELLPLINALFVRRSGVVGYGWGSPICPHNPELTEWCWGQMSRVQLDADRHVHRV